VVDVVTESFGRVLFDFFLTRVMTTFESIDSILSKYARTVILPKKRETQIKLNYNLTHFVIEFERLEQRALKYLFAFYQSRDDICTEVFIWVQASWFFGIFG
jgi:hypothetical protein